MPLIREKDGKRLHIKSALMGESLVSHEIIGHMDLPAQVRLFPEVHVLKIGGQSICDRGAKAIPAITEELVRLRNDYKMLITTGGGTRSRHIYTIGLELGMPTGMIASFGSSISEQNALLLATVLSPWGGIKIHQDDIVKLHTYFGQGCIPVMQGMPPYNYFAMHPPKGRIPIHRTDVGTILVADLIGAKSCLFVKDERGLYTDDPKKNPAAEFIPHIGVNELRERDLEDLAVERPCLDILAASDVLDQIQIINGLEPGNITRALAGEHVGSIIYKD